jgi:hypothetical protein
MIYELEMKLQNDWPFYVKHQEFRGELYDKMQTYKKRLDISKEKDNTSKTKNTKKGDKSRDDNVKDLIDEKFAVMFRKEVKKYLNELIELYETTKTQMTNEINMLKSEQPISKSLTHKQCILKNYETYYDGIYKWTTIPYVSEFDRPTDLCFFRIPLTEDEILHAKDILMKDVGMSISITNYLLVGLLYGIGVYHKGLPSSYLRFLQTCSQNRKIGIVLSDRTLSMGISMPFLSVLLFQHENVEFVQMEAVQMMGRCGRRNRDNTGHLLLCNLNPQKLLLKKKTRITGSNIKVPNIGLLKYLRPTGDIANITRHTIYSYCNHGPFTTSLSTSIVVRTAHPRTGDYYTESHNSWRTQYSPHLSMNEKAVIWKTTTCFPYPDDLYGNISALCFILLLKNEQLVELLETCNDRRILMRCIIYIISTCYFHNLLIDNTIIKSIAGRQINDVFAIAFGKMECFNDLYGASPTITEDMNIESLRLYDTLFMQLRDNKYMCNNAGYIRFLHNITAFIVVLSHLNAFRGTNIMYALERIYTNIHRLILNYSLRNCNES